MTAVLAFFTRIGVPASTMALVVMVSGIGGWLLNDLRHDLAGIASSYATDNDVTGLNNLIGWLRDDVEQLEEAIERITVYTQELGIKVATYTAQVELLWEREQP